MTATTLSPREMKRLRKQGADYVSPSPYTVRAAFRRGDLFTKLSAVVFGLGDIVRKQYVKGIAMLALEIAYFVFMAINGVDYLSKLPTLGTNAGGKKLVDGFWVYTEPDRSVVILLYGVATLVITAAFIGLWVMSVALHTSPRCCSRRTARLRASWTMSASCSMPRRTFC